MPYYRETSISRRLIKYYRPFQKVIKRLHNISFINALPFSCPLSFHLPSTTRGAPFITWAISASHYYTTRGPLSSPAACVRFFFHHLFWEGESKGDLHYYSWLRQGSHISQGALKCLQSRASAHSFTKGQRQLTPHFPTDKQAGGKGLFRTQRYKEGNLLQGRRTGD